MANKERNGEKHNIIISALYSFRVVKINDIYNLNYLHIFQVKSDQVDLNYAYLPTFGFKINNIIYTIYIYFLYVTIQYCLDFSKVYFIIFYFKYSWYMYSIHHDFKLSVCSLIRTLREKLLKNWYPRHFLCEGYMSN